MMISRVGNQHTENLMTTCRKHIFSIVQRRHWNSLFRTFKNMQFHSCFCNPRLALLLRKVSCRNEAENAGVAPPNMTDSTHHPPHAKNTQFLDVIALEIPTFCSLGSAYLINNTTDSHAQNIGNSSTLRRGCRIAYTTWRNALKHCGIKLIIQPLS